MKTADLSSHALGYAVAIANGIPPENIHFNVKPTGQGRREGVWVGSPDGLWTKWTPWKIWAQGGTIIEREHIDLVWQASGELEWTAYSNDDKEHKQVGFTPLAAAMRCFVASKLGDEVDIPEKFACSPKT